jgi:sugar lactone lactonase YvrE
VTTIAGTGNSEFAGDGGPALAAALRFPYGIAVAADGTIYVADNGNFRIRKIDPAGIITTVAGDGTLDDVLNTNGGDGGPATAAQLAGVLSIALDPTGTTLYIADIDANRIRQVNLTTGIIGPFAGTGIFGFGYQGDGWPASAAQLAVPQGVAVDPWGHVYIADTLNCVIRKVDGGAGFITTVAGSGACTTAGDGGPAINASFRDPTRLTWTAMVTSL